MRRGKAFAACNPPCPWEVHATASVKAVDFAPRGACLMAAVVAGAVCILFLGGYDQEFVFFFGGYDPGNS
jgi:hypothetical protein